MESHGPPSPESNDILIPGTEEAVAAFDTGSAPAAAEPRRPRAPKATSNADGTVSLMWEPLPEGTVTSYVILATREGQPRHAITGRLPSAPTWTTIDADELVEGASYTFQVAPINVHTHGPPSVASDPVHIAAAPKEVAEEGHPAPDRASGVLARVNDDRVNGERGVQ